MFVLWTVYRRAAAERDEAMVFAQHWRDRAGAAITEACRLR